MAIKHLASFQAKRGDDVEYKGGHYVLSIKSGKPAIFHEGEYILFAWTELVPHPAKTGWMIPVRGQPTTEKTTPSGGIFMYTVEIMLNGERIEFKGIKSTSVGRAKNSAVNKLARNLNTTPQNVYLRLRNPQNEIRVTQS